MPTLLHFVILLLSASSRVRLVAGHQADQEICRNPESNMLRPQFVLFGDSLTQRSFDEGGWGARLASEYQRKVRSRHVLCGKMLCTNEKARV